MLGFGFMDNIIMIQAGDYIDTTFGAVLGISTLTAAGFGNVCSDVSGVLFGGVVESAADKLNLARPQWSAAQRELRAVRLASTAGAAVGIVCGCLLGMCTLLLKDLEAAERLKKAKALETVFATVMQNGHQLIGAERCTLYLYDEASHELWTKVSTGADVVVALPLGRQAIACAAARERKLVNVADAYADSRFDRSIDGQTGFVTRQVLAVPIVDDDERLVGCIQAINKSGSREPFTPADEKLVRMLATHIQLFTQELGALFPAGGVAIRSRRAWSEMEAESARAAKMEENCAVERDLKVEANLALDKKDLELNKKDSELDQKDLELDQKDMTIDALEKQVPHQAAPSA